MQAGNKMEKGKKRSYKLLSAISVIALSVAVCLSLNACKEDEKQKEKPSDSSGYSVTNEIELPEVDL